MIFDTISPEDLDVLLEKERTFLIEGRLESLGLLLPTKEKLVEQLLENKGLSSATIRPLEGKLRRNQLLLDSALEGIRSVEARLLALRQVRGTLETYDAQGRKKRVTTATLSQVEKHA